MAAAAAMPRSAFAEGDDEKVLAEAQVLRDPDVPVAGNVTGDITVVEWFDYQYAPYSASSSLSCGRWWTTARSGW